MVGDNLQFNGGISLIPSSMHGEDLGACLNRAVDVLLTVVVNDVAHGVPNSGRWEIRKCCGWGGWGGLGWGSDLDVLHSAKESIFVYENG